jgi:hypothetical protein
MAKPSRNWRGLLAVNMLAGGVLFGPDGIAMAGTIRVWPGDGGVAIAKEFRVPPGTRISGIRLASLDPGTVYPEIRLVPGRVRDRRAAIRVVHDAVGDGTHLWATWPEYTVMSGTTWHVRVSLPAEPNIARLPRLGTLGGVGTDGVFVVAEGGELIAPVLANLDCDLIIEDPIGKSALANQTPVPDAPGQEIGLAVNVQERAVALSLTLAKPDRVRVAVYDVRGRLLQSILPGRELLAGEHSLTWDLRDTSGSIAARGGYFIHVSGDHASLSRRVILR